MTYDAILHRASGKTAAIAVYVLYLLSIPSLAIFAPLGAALAYLSLRDAAPLAQVHLNEQIRIFWIAFAWGVGLAVISIPAWALTLVLIGFPMLWLIGAAAFAVMVWFTWRSAVGLVRLFEHHAPQRLL